MSITDKFNYLKQTKENLKEVINLVKDEDEDKLTEESTFRSYPEALRKNYIKALNEGSDFIYDSLDKVTEEGETVVLDNTAIAPMKVSLNGNITQEKINAEAGTEIVNTEISISDANNEKENYITLQGNTYQETIEAQAGSEVEDTELAVNDVDSSKENYITLNGNTSQDTTSGKNLFTGLIKNVRLDPNNGEQFSGSTGASTDFIPVNINSNNSYYLSGLVDTIRSFTCAYNSNKEFLGRTSAQTVSEKALTYYSFTAGTPTGTGDIAYIRITQYIQGEGTIDIIDGAKMQLEQGSTATSYEPYTGGIPSPNPDYPQEVKVVKGENVVSVSGKNLFDKNNVFSTYKSRIETLDTGVKVIISEGYTTSFALFKIGGKELLGKTITIKRDITNSSSNNGRIRLFYGNNNNATISSIVTLTTSGSSDVTLETNFPNDTDGIFLGLYATFNNQQEADVYTDFTDLQVELGSQATPYVPYSKTDYEVNLGKNLFDYQNQNYNAVRASYVLENNGLKITSSGSYAMITTDFDVEIGKTYTISFDTINSDNMAAGIQIRSSTALIISGGGDTGNHSLTFTPTENKVSFRFYSNTSGTETTNEVQYQNIQIEEGSVATSYSSYFTPIELCKIGDYQDYLFKNNGKWYKYKAINKIVLDGINNSFANKTGNAGNVYATSNITDILPTSSNDTSILAIANHFKVYPYTSLNNDIDVGFVAYERANILRFKFGANSSLTTLELANQWLSTHNTIFYYVLATPIEEEITNSTLIEQLNNLYTAQLNNGVNYIDTETENLLPYINLKYNVVTQMPSPERPSEINKVTGENIVSVSGKNLLDMSYLVEENADKTYGAYGMWAFNVSDVAGTYTLSRENSNVVANSSYIVIGQGTDVNEAYANKVWLAHPSSANLNKQSVTITNENKLWLFFHSNIERINNIIDDFGYLMLEEGSTATSYEPYSKTDYPINLVSKNLLDINKSTTGYRVNRNTGELLANSNFNASDYIEVESGETYYLQNGNPLSGACYDKNKEYISAYNSNGGNLATMPENAKYVRLTFQPVNADTVMFFKGSTATDYEPYFTPIELCKINTYKDYFHKDNGKWYVHKEIGKVVFDENTTFEGYQSFGNYYRGQKKIQDAKIFETNNIEIFSNYFKGNNNVFTYTKAEVGNIGQYKNTIDFYFISTQPTQADFKTWLSTHNTIVYYPLATSTETEIISLTLIEQLDNLYTAQLSNGINYIITETGNLLPYIDLKYNVVTQMPSPERPSEVKLVKGENVVGIQGKNLLKLPNMTLTMNGVTVTTYEDGRVVINGTATGVVNIINFVLPNIVSYTNNKQFTYSLFYVSGGATNLNSTTSLMLKKGTVGESSYGDFGGISIKQNNYTENANKLITTIDENSVTRLQFISLYTEQIFDNLTYKLQLEEGSTATPYVPYSKTDYPINLGTLELCKIGDYKDYLFKRNGKWYVHKDVNKVVFDGSENWIERRNADNVKQFRGNKTIRYVGTSKQFCNYGIYNSIAYNFGRVGQFVIANDYIFVCVDDNAVLEDFKTTIAANNLIGYYPLTTPTEEEITNSTLIEQLEVISKAKSAKDKTYITQTNEEIPFIIDATAIKKYEEV